MFSYMFLCIEPYFSCIYQNFHQVVRIRNFTYIKERNYFSSTLNALASNPLSCMTSKDFLGDMKIGLFVCSVYICESNERVNF